MDTTNAFVMKKCMQIERNLHLLGTFQDLSLFPLGGVGGFGLLGLFGGLGGFGVLGLLGILGGFGILGLLGVFGIF